MIEFAPMANWPDIAEVVKVAVLSSSVPPPRSQPLVVSKKSTPPLGAVPLPPDTVTVAVKVTGLSYVAGLGEAAAVTLLLPPVGAGSTVTVQVPLLPIEAIETRNVIHAGPSDVTAVDGLDRVRSGPEGGTDPRVICAIAFNWDVA